MMGHSTNEGDGRDSGLLSFLHARIPNSMVRLKTEILKYISPGLRNMFGMVMSSSKSGSEDCLFIYFVTRVVFLSLGNFKMYEPQLPEFPSQL